MKSYAVTNDYGVVYYDSCSPFYFSDGMTLNEARGEKRRLLESGEAITVMVVRIVGDSDEE